MVSFWSPLIHIVKSTEKDVEALNLQAIESEVKAQLASVRNQNPGNLIEDRVAQYLSFCINLPTPQIRGRVCAMAERCAYRALRSRDPLGSGFLRQACTYAATSHSAMDVPKHHSAEMVLTFAAELRKSYGFKSRAPRSTKWMSRRLLLPAVRSKNRMFEQAVDILDAAEAQTGAVWVDRNWVVLGKAAGERMVQLLVNRPFAERCVDQEPQRTVLLELSCLLRHRLAGMLGTGVYQGMLGAQQHHKQRFTDLNSKREIKQEHTDT
jgi:hypothetical protein